MGKRIKRTENVNRINVFEKWQKDYKRHEYDGTENAFRYAMLKGHKR
jgi:hypothetical protein